MQSFWSEPEIPATLCNGQNAEKTDEKFSGLMFNWHPENFHFFSAMYFGIFPSFCPFHSIVAAASLLVWNIEIPCLAHVYSLFNRLSDTNQV